MKLYVNTTSPFVRLARIAVIEKGLSDRVELIRVDPWGGDPAFAAASPHERVPALVTDRGVGIAESSLVLTYLDRMAPEPPLFPEDGLAETLSKAAEGLGALELSAAIIIGRKSAPDFDAGMVGRKRHRTIAGAFDRLDAAPPRDFAEGPDIAGIAAAVAVDYALFRFPDIDWLGPRPGLAAWRERQRGRPSLEETMPHA